MHLGSDLSLYLYTEISMGQTHQVVDEPHSESDVDVVEGDAEGGQHVEDGHLSSDDVDEGENRHLESRIENI